MSRSQQQVKHQPVSDRAFILPFGRYKGETLSDILECDPNWLVWAHNNTDFELDHILLEEAECGANPAINPKLGLKPYNPVIQICKCGHIDAYRGDGHECGVQAYNRFNNDEDYK